MTQHFLYLSIFRAISIHLDNAEHQDDIYNLPRKFSILKIWAIIEVMKIIILSNLFGIIYCLKI